MNEQVVFPGWAVAVLVALFLATLAVARWGMKYLADRIEGDIRVLQGELKAAALMTQQSLGDLRERVTRIETILDVGSGGGAESPPRRARTFTPPPVGGTDT